MFCGGGGAGGVWAVFCGGFGFLSGVSDSPAAIIYGSFLVVGEDTVGFEEVLYLLVGPLFPLGVEIGMIFFDQGAKCSAYVFVGGIVVDAEGFVMIGHCAEIHFETSGCNESVHFIPKEAFRQPQLAAIAETCMYGHERGFAVSEVGEGESAGEEVFDWSVSMCYNSV